jgi:ABC-type transport system involved in multi-copper enzyme maturation permease subunit
MIGSMVLISRVGWGLMIVLPVIERELRAASRHPLTYNLRVLGGLALVVVLGMFWLEDIGGPGVGGRLFGDFHRALFFSIWILVPLLTADCISRERREGTLPLLFLTPLRARDIVYAKGLAHGLRSFTLWLAVLPVFTICLLGGGVGWPDVALSSLVNFGSICLALGAGLIASSRTRVWTRALAWAACLAFLFLASFGVVLLFTVLIYWTAHGGRPLPGLSELTGSPNECLAVMLDLQQVWRWWLITFRLGPSALLRIYATVALLCALGLYAFCRFSAWNVQRTWQEKPSSSRVIWLKDKLFKPVLFQKQLRGWLRWELRHNPIGWLERRSWSGRLVVWAWFAVVVCVYSSVFANLALYQRIFHTLQSFLATLLAGSIAISAASSFRRERETGVLELLLVAPLREWQIIAGRVRGLWGQFIPAVVLLFAVWLYGATFLSSDNEVPSVIGYAVTFATLPVVGLYFSLAKPNFIAALVWTLLVQIVIPAAVMLVARLDNAGESPLADTVAQAFVQITVATFLGRRLLLLLKRREFVTSS